MQNESDVLKAHVVAASQVIAKNILNIFAEDAHRFSERPCSTCRLISAALGEPWGCNAVKPKVAK